MDEKHSTLDYGNRIANKADRRDLIVLWSIGVIALILLLLFAGAMIGVSYYDPIRM